MSIQLAHLQISVLERQCDPPSKCCCTPVTPQWEWHPDSDVPALKRRRKLTVSWLDTRAYVSWLSNLARETFAMFVWQHSVWSFVWRESGYVFVCFLTKAGHAVKQLVEALRYKLEGCGFDSCWCHLNFSLTVDLGSTHPLIEMITKNISWGLEAAGA